MSPRNRFYGFALFGSSLLWLGVFVVFWLAQRRVSSRFSSRVDELAVMVEEMRSRPVPTETTTTTEPEPAARAGSSVPVGGVPFRVLGSGRLGPNYAYLDIRHVDGARRRYYCRVEDGYSGVQRMFGIIDADALDAEYGLLAAEDDRFQANADWSSSAVWE